MATRLSDIGNLSLAGSSEIFNAAMKQNIDMYWKPICREVQESKQIGNYDTVGDLGPAAYHVEEDPITFDGISYDNRTYITSRVVSKGVKVTMEANIFDQYNEIKKQFGKPLTVVMNDFKEVLVADVYNDAFTTNGIDGVAQISNSHPLSGSPLLNDNLVTGPLTPANFKAGKLRFEFLYTQAGRHFPTHPTHLLIHPGMQYVAYEMLNSALMAFELSNTKNSLQALQPTKLLMNPYLDYNTSTDVSPWYLLDKSIDDAGVVLQKKQGLQLRNWFENAELTLKGVAYEVYGAGIVAPGYGIVGSTGA